MDEVRDVKLRDRTEEVELDSFLPGSVVEIEGVNILKLRRRHSERRTFEQDPGAKEYYSKRDKSDQFPKARKTHSTLEEARGKEVVVTWPRVWPR